MKKIISILGYLIAIVITLYVSSLAIGFLIDNSYEEIYEAGYNKGFVDCVKNP